MRTWIREACLTFIDYSIKTGLACGALALLLYAGGASMLAQTVVLAWSCGVLGSVIVLVVFFWRDGPGRRT